MLSSLLLLACSTAEPEAPPPPPAPTLQTEEEWKALYDAWNYPAPIPDFQLIDQEGERFQLSRYDESYLLIGFVFTRCPVQNACPLTMRKLREVQVDWAKAEAEGKTRGRKLDILAVTLDPEYDTPERLKAYGETYGADFGNWTMATGPHMLVYEALPSLFNVLAFPTGEGGLTHGITVGLLKPGLSEFGEWKDNAFEPDDVLTLVLSGP